MLFDENYFSPELELPILKQRTNFFNLAVNYGQFNTIEKWVCEDKRGNPIPWYTYPAIEYLNNLDFSKKKVFEFGSGNSSLYWAKRCSKLVSVENNKAWYEKIISKALPNQKVILCESEKDYASTIGHQAFFFDVIIIDGIERRECALAIEDKLNTKDGFMIIFDNSDWHSNTARILRDKYDLIQIDFHGFTPINNYTSTTSILLSRNANFKSSDNVQPHFSRCALRFCSVTDKPE
ncbi:hypothetical protein [Gayadomonas joobiniege]|uniref:hypothetical protein n=1 Tax=Gayadomonas joobiniege TaxID=1234606 RepID=UPI00037A84E0|nr:hypothetical protein [Gayadomonas joobiniege]